MNSDEICLQNYIFSLISKRSQGQILSICRYAFLRREKSEKKKRAYLYIKGNIENNNIYFK